MSKLKILELFGGIGACSKSLERLGIDYEIADYVEIDKYAVKSFNAIHNTNFEPQDICKWDKDIEVDLIMHGSPCQDFSLAGKQAGGDKNSGTRSSLMYETIRIVEKLKPKYVIWENVKNLLSKKHRHNFDAYLETMESLGYVNYYQVLNAKDYGIPQNRERVFTVSILGNENYEFPKGEECDNSIKVIGNYMPSGHDASRIVDEDGLAPTVKENHGTVTAVLQRFEFPPKQELKLKLKDMLEDEVDEKYYLSDRQIKDIQNWNAYEKPLENMEKIDKTDIRPTLTTRSGAYAAGMILVKNATKKGYLEATDGDGIDVSSRMEHHRGNVQKDKIQTLTTSGGNDRGVCVGTYQYAKSDKFMNGKDRLQLGKEVSDTLQTTPKEGICYNDLRIRKLTPKECWRLMGFDDEDFEKASQVNSCTQLYKQAGNSICVPVLIAILNNLLNN